MDQEVMLNWQDYQISKIGNRIGGILVSVLASSAVVREFELLSSQTEDY